MNRLSPLLLLTIFITPLMAQSVDSNAKQERYAVSTLMKYCARVETVSDFQQPRMFAQVSSGLGPSSGWAEFESKVAWKEAGKPKPLALVWYDDAKVVRVAITTGDDGRSYAEYCYRPDGTLAQLRAVPAVKTNCDRSMFHCDVTFREGFRLYPPKGMLASPLARRAVQEPLPVFQAKDVDLYDLFSLRPLMPEKATISYAPMDWPEYLTVWDLPFNRLLYVSAERTK
jgi:hypothetical protein